MAEAKNSKPLLYNVAVIRPILIVLLVFYHAFLVYAGGWTTVGSFPVIRTYWWLDKLSYAFLLETFVFVSGFVFGYQVRIKGDVKLQAKSLLWGKFKRLMIPSIFFSLLYVILFLGFNDSILKIALRIMSGVGHMWFLPVLFMCFVGIWIIEKLRLKPALTIPILFLCSMFSFIQLPWRLSTIMYYMLFFYAGYWFQRKNINLERYYKPSCAVGLSIAFLIIFPLLTIFRENAVCLIDAAWGGAIR